MSRRPKLTKAKKRRRRQQRPATRPPQLDAVQDIIEGIMCSRTSADDYAGMCDARIADLDPDLDLAEIAATLWRGREGPAQPLSVALADLATECQRHRDALVEIARRLELLAADESLHDHLDPKAIDPDIVTRMLLAGQQPD
jgi:hypothetical protein